MNLKRMRALLDKEKDKEIRNIETIHEDDNAQVIRKVSVDREG